jgi:hypothetical protein
MDFTELKNDLDAYISGGQLNLPATSTLNSADIKAVIDTYLPTSQVLQINVTSQNTANNQFTIVGNAKLFDNQPSTYSVTAVFQVVNGAPVMVITAALDSVSTTWNFGMTFPEMKGTVLSRFQFSSPQLILSSVDNTVTGATEVFVPGLNFYGVPLPVGPAKPAAAILGDISNLPIYGLITFQQSMAVMSLTSKTVSMPFSVISLTLNVGFSLVTQILPYKTKSTYSPTAQLITTVTLQSGTSFEVSMPLFSESATIYNFDLVTGKGIPLTGYSELNQFSPNLGSLVPTELPAATLSLSRLGLAVTVNNGTPSVVSVFIGVALDATVPWTIIPSILEVNGLNVEFSIPMGASSSIGSGVHVVVTGRFEIASSFEYQVSARAPELVITGGIAPGQTIPLGKLVQHFLGTDISSIDKLTVYQFDFTADIRNESYAFAAGVSDLWTVSFPLVNLSIEALTAEVNYATNQISFAMSASWVLNKIPMMVTAARPPGDSGWNLSIGTPPAGVIDLIDITQNFLGNVTFPSFVPQQLQIMDVLFAGNTKTLDYTLRAAALAGS